MRWLLPFLLLVACADGTVTGYAGRGPWRLVEIDGEAAAAGTTLSFPAAEYVTGTLPCNAFTAHQHAPYPSFSLSHMEIGTTACDASPLERRILEALTSMTLAEAQGSVLTLSNEQGREMVFRLS